MMSTQHWLSNQHTHVGILPPLSSATGMAEGQAFPLVLNQLYVHSWLSSCCQIAFNSTLPSASCPAVTPKHREAPTNPKLAHEIPPEILPQQYPQPNIHFVLFRTEIPHLLDDLSWPAASFEKRYLLSCPAQTTTHGQCPLFYYLPVPRRIWLHSSETAPAAVADCS